MKKHLIFTFFLSAALIGLFGCKKTAQEITCNLSAPENQSAVAMTIIYTATQTGDGVISSLSYATNSGMITIQNPSLPWADTISVITGTKIAISASGTVKNGMLKVTYQGYGGGSTFQASDFCQHQTD
ncbi:MAG: hypothetical protein PHF97_10390 [Bacteroidales bacterium]|jgi:hypothetical protein|nr:hypothetical protein [Bacteroidales bacterium]MDD4604202.1 hypothetical protein [Bacteroidales bacterium]